MLSYLGLRIGKLSEIDIEKYTWPLYITKRTLTIVCQIFAIRFNRENSIENEQYQVKIRNEIQQLWIFFLNSLKKSIIKRQNETIYDGL